jgi:general secretion pathway protein H
MKRLGKKAKRRSRRGFSLIELVIVVSIVATLTGLAAVSLSGRSGENLMRREMALATAMIGRAQMKALGSAQPVSLLLSDDRRQLAISGSEQMPQAFQTGVTLQIRSADGEDRDHLRFYPSGSASGGALILAGHGLSGAILIDWLTGEARPQALKPLKDAKTHAAL